MAGPIDQERYDKLQNAQTDSVGRPIGTGVVGFWMVLVGTVFTFILPWINAQPALTGFAFLVAMVGFVLCVVAFASARSLKLPGGLALPGLVIGLIDVGIAAVGIVLS